MHLFVSTLWGIILTSGALFAQNATIPGQISTPYPTLVNLAVEWQVQGDDNFNGTVTARFRQANDVVWKTALPLFRVPADTNEGFSWANHHAGSIFDLAPGTTYNIELTLIDPDGGSAKDTVTASTRPIPRAAANATVVPVTPSTFPSAASASQAGQILLLSAGHYSTFTFPRDGTTDRPIVVRAAVNRAAIIDGDVRLDGRQYVFVEGLTVNGKIKFNGATGIAVRQCSVQTAADGIVALTAVTNCYIADNVVQGSTVWADSTLGANGANLGEGIEITGPGNVICYNRVRGFRDCLSFIEDAGAVNQVCIDFYNNDIYVGADDGIEADFAMGNCRIMRNRLTNCFVGLSSQPSLGGPTYFIRNVMYNIVYAPFKLHRGSIGDVALHNTAVKCGDAFACYAGVTWSRAYFRNNLFIGGTGGGTYGTYANGTGRVAVLADADATCSFDYDGYGSIGTGTFGGRIGAVSFSSLTALRTTTTEAHAVEVGMSVFAQAVTFPAAGPYPEKIVPDLRPRSGGAAQDAGLALPNINDMFAGNSPDLGAYEVGNQLPYYGPRESDSTGINDRPAALVPASHLVLYANPSSQCVLFTSRSQILTSLKIYSLQGRLMADLIAPAGAHAMTWETGACPGGMYVVEFGMDGKLFRQELVLVK